MRNEVVVAWVMVRGRVEDRLRVIFRVGVVVRVSARVKVTRVRVRVRVKDSVLGPVG